MIKGVKLLSGEILIGEVADVFTDDRSRAISDAALLVPVQQGLSLTKFIPFSKKDTPIIINETAITCVFDLVDEIINSYKDWAQKIKAQDAGIVLSQGIPEELKNQK